MGMRGPLRSPNSVRGRAEAKKREREQEQTAARVSAGLPVTPASEPKPSADRGELPIPPDGFGERQREMFAGFVADLIAAQVPLKRADSHAIAMAVRCMTAIEAAERIINDPEANIEQNVAALRLLSGFGKDMKDWLQIVCAAPGARARIGIKPAPEKKLGALGKLLEDRKNRNK